MAHLGGQVLYVDFRFASRCENGASLLSVRNQRLTFEESVFRRPLAELVN